MATSDPIEPQDLVSLLRSGKAPLGLRRFAARGVLPLDHEGQIRALLAVIPDSDPETAETAQKALRALPPDRLMDFLNTADPSSAELDILAQHSDDSFVLERIIRHRNADDRTLETLARTATGAPQEALIVNQVRLLRRPALIEALFENPNLSLDGRRRLNEIREEFFEKQRRRLEAGIAAEEEARRSLEEAEEAERAAQEQEETDVAETETSAEAVSTAEEGASTSLSIGAIYRRIAIMTVMDKIHLAYSSGKEERRILIGDANKLVGLAVLKSRGLTPSEVEAYCSIRNLDEEIFRRIAANREWVHKPNIILALVKNPKVPLSITLPLVKYVNMRELKHIMRDPNLPEALRKSARRIVLEKRR